MSAQPPPRPPAGAANTLDDPDATAARGATEAAPMLALLGALLRTAIGEGTELGRGRVRLTGIDPAPDGATLRLQLQGLQGFGRLLGGPLELRVVLHEVGRERSRCGVTVAAPGGQSGRRGLGRLLGGAVERLPRPLLEQLLAWIAGDAFTVEDEGLILHHRALLRSLRRRRDFA